MRKSAFLAEVVSIMLFASAAFAGGGHHHGGSIYYSDYNRPGCAVNPWLCPPDLTPAGRYWNSYNGYYGGYGGYYSNAPIIIPIDLGGSGMSLSDGVGTIVYEGARIPGRAITGAATGLIDGFTGNNRSMASPSKVSYTQPSEVIVRETVREVPAKQEPTHVTINNYYGDKSAAQNKPTPQSSSAPVKKAKKKRLVKKEYSEVVYVDMHKK